MLLDLDMRDRNVVVIGGRRLAELKVRSLVQQGIRTRVVASGFVPGLKNIDPRLVSLIRAPPSDYPEIIARLRPSIVLSTLRDFRLNARVAKIARSVGSLVNVVDTPSLCDFAMPATGSIGRIRVGVVTGGSSPAMAGLIRDRLMQAITTEQVGQVELQGRIRKKLTERVPAATQRRKLVYAIIRDKKVSGFLREGMFDEALAHAFGLVEDAAARAG